MIDTVEKLINNGVILTDDKKYIKGCSKDNTLNGVVVVPNSIKGFEEYGEGFKNCKQITHISLPSSFDHIDFGVFQDCSNLMQIEMPDSVEYIEYEQDGDNRSLGLSSLRRLRIPQKTHVRDSLLGELNNIFFEVDDNNPYYTSIDGSLYSKDKDILIKYYSNKVLDDVVIDSNIVKIGEYAFSNCTTINTVYLPDSVKSIENWAFVNCASLKQIRLSGEIEAIKDYTFYGCSNLSRIIIPEKVKKIHEGAFGGCESLYRIEIKGSSVEIDKRSFIGCRSIQEFCGNVDTDSFLYTHLSDSDSIRFIESNENKIIAEDVFRRNETQFKVMSILYNGFGMNITKIRGNSSECNSFKSVDATWAYTIEDFYSEQQTKEFILSENWYRNSGIGLVLGWNKYRAIDVDYVEYNCIDRLIEEFLSYLSLPKDYPWVIRSGSGRGFHIIFKCGDLNSEFETKSYSPNFHYIFRRVNGLFSRLELRWKTHLVLPPSLCHNGNSYEFLCYKTDAFGNTEYIDKYGNSFDFPRVTKEQRKKSLSLLFRNIPTHEPLEIGVNNIHNLILHYCGRVEIKSYTTYYSGEGFDFKLAEFCKCYAEQDSCGYESTVEVKDDSIEWLEKCATSDSFNSLALKYIFGDGVKADFSKALHYFTKSNSDISHFNIASLIACGWFEGTYEDVEYHLSMIHDDNFLSFVNSDQYDDYVPSQLYSEIRSNAKKILSNREYFLKDTVVSAHRLGDCIREYEYYLFLDAETTGLPNNYNAPSSDVENWPRLVQIAWILTDQNGNRINTGDFIIKPEDFTIPIASSNIHGITTQKAKEEGANIKEVLAIFLKYFNKATFIVGHNVEFDKKIVGAELVRLGMRDVLDTKISYCTMQASIDLCKIPSSYGYGYNFPKLQELYKKLFGTEFDDAHNAMSDIEATEKCFWELKKRNLL